MGVIPGTDNSETLNGTETGDLFLHRKGNDILNGFGGFDYASFETHVGNASLLAGWDIDLVGKKATTSYVSGTGITQIRFTETDTLNSIEGAYGSAKNDTFNMTDANYCYGRDGNDLAIINTSASKGLALYDGGFGIDTAVFNRLAQGVTVNLDNIDPLTSVANVFTRDDPFSAFARGFVKLRDVEHVVGSAYNDILRGNAFVSNNLNGGGGGDRFLLSETSVLGVIDGYNGSSGKDALDARYFLQSGLQIDLGKIDATGDVKLSGTATKIANLANIEDVLGTAAADGIDGSPSNNTLIGSFGRDVISGWDGSDWIVGGDGKDFLAGGNGIPVEDNFYNPDGAADVFVYSATTDSRPNGTEDVISDFEHGLDKIHLGAIDAKSGTTINDAFTFIGLIGTNLPANGVGGRVGYFYSGTDKTMIAADVNGDITFDLLIELKGHLTISATDFIL